MSRPRIRRRARRGGGRRPDSNSNKLRPNLNRPSLAEPAAGGGRDEQRARGGGRAQAEGQDRGERAERRLGTEKERFREVRRRFGEGSEKVRRGSEKGQMNVQKRLGSLVRCRRRRVHHEAGRLEDDRLNGHVRDAWWAYAIAKPGGLINHAQWSVSATTGTLS